MKKLLLIFSLFTFGAAFKAQCIFIYAAEKIKTAEVPVPGTEFDVTINDSIKMKRTSDHDGSLGRISLEKGKYTIKISNPEFTEGFEKEVVVNESRTTEVSVFIARLSAAQLEEKKKK